MGSEALAVSNGDSRALDGFGTRTHKIEVRDNRFTQTNVPCVAADNVGNLIFENNEYSDNITPVVAAHCGVNGETVE